MRLRVTPREKRGLPPSEHTEAVRLMRVVRLHEPQHPELRLLYHIPNGGLRQRTVARKLRAEGVKPGVSDYCLPVARAGCHGLYIELKAIDGVRSPEQRAFVDAVRAQGYRAEFCAGWVEAWRVICDYLGIRSQVW